MPPILYEDENVFVINKPAGLVVHGDGKSPEISLADMILTAHPEMKEVGEPLMINGTVIYRPGIVHRLDKETSGALIIAKNQETFSYLKEQFQNHTVEKTYHTFTYGSVKDDSGVIDAAIGRSTSDIRKWSTGKAARGMMRDAVTEFRVLARYGLPEGVVKGSTEEGTFTFLEAKPKTGRTHQIRVHLRHINHPVVCDPLYAPNRAPALGFARLALHAKAVTFMLPSGKTISIEAPYPDDFENALKLVL